MATPLSDLMTYPLTYPVTYLLYCHAARDLWERYEGMIQVVGNTRGSSKRGGTYRHSRGERVLVWYTVVEHGCVNSTHVVEVHPLVARVPGCVPLFEGKIHFAYGRAS
eukprot:6199206-Pleurochrysis_carterae.AAC.2